VFFVTIEIVMILFAAGLCVQIWKKYHINYVFIFKIDPNYRMYHLQFYKVGMIFLFVWIFFLTWQIVKMKMPDQFYNNYATFSLCCLLFFILLCILPFGLYSPARWSLAKNLGKIFISPYPKVTFRESTMANCLASMITPI
jgi:putative flippase GtrA